MEDDVRTRRANMAARLSAIEDTQNQMSLLIKIGFALFIICILCVIAYLLLQNKIRQWWQGGQGQNNQAAQVPAVVVREEGRQQNDVVAPVAREEGAREEDIREGKIQNDAVVREQPPAPVIVDQPVVPSSVSQHEVRRDGSGEEHEVRVERSYSVHEIDRDQLPQTAVIREPDDLPPEAPAPKRIKVDKDLRRVVVKETDLRPSEKRQILVPKHSKCVP